jgi:hypothetical protein
MHLGGGRQGGCPSTIEQSAHCDLDRRPSIFTAKDALMSSHTLDNRATAARAATVYNQVPDGRINDAGTPIDHAGTPFNDV